MTHDNELKQIRRRECGRSSECNQSGKKACIGYGRRVEHVYCLGLKYSRTLQPDNAIALG